ncbi:SDR family oxidoreductase [Pseudidiomarina sediminum]|uniref:SDR family oxidoreductase n=1 Tax=Pseudidiomarina sediminum TaxID=431675 RepID=A0A432Z2L9_9GAMM|nr:SDR family oxidoreductase [Pseudidiomarina sediminum]RUO72142.1 SDR family oxidoreductase [Pseudidiomarina sediminum]
MSKLITDWSQQHVLLTGAQGGLGQELARQLTEKGALVTLVGRREEALREQAVTLGQRDFLCDLTQAEELAGLIELVQASRPRITGWIHAAGSSVTELYTDTPWTKHAEVMRLNTLVPMQLTHALLPLLQRQHRAWLLHVGSVFGALGFPTQASYCASKAALARFCEALQREVEPSACTIMYAAPRAIKTAMNDGVMHRFNQNSGTHEDNAARVASLLLRQIEQGQRRQTIGWPERLFVKLNALVPQLIDANLRKPLRQLRQLLQEQKS